MDHLSSKKVLNPHPPVYCRQLVIETAIVYSRQMDED